MEQRVSLITLGVDDLARSRRFYETGLGWTVCSSESLGVVCFQLTGMALALYGRTDLAAELRLPAAPPATSPGPASVEASSTSPGSTSPGSTSPGSTSPGSTSPGSTSPGTAAEARDGGHFGGIALAHNVRSREAVDRTLTEAVAAGARLLAPAADTFWGGYSGYFADPDGHPWEVAWNPHSPLDEAGGFHWQG